MSINNTPHPSSCACKDCRLSRAIRRSLPYDSEAAFLAFLGRRGVAKFTSGVAGLCGAVAYEIEAIERESEAVTLAIETMRAQRDEARSEVEELKAVVDSLPGDWRKDSSLEKWFPLSAWKLAQLERENANLKEELKYAQNRPVE